MAVVAIIAILLAIAAVCFGLGGLLLYCQKQLEKQVLTAGESIVGEQAAQLLLREAGLSTRITRDAAGIRNIGFDPRRNCIKLTASVAASTSTAAVAAVAHEVGHAVCWAQRGWSLIFFALLGSVPVVAFWAIGAVGCGVAVALGEASMAQPGLGCNLLVTVGQLALLIYELIANRHAWRLLRGSEIAFDEKAVRITLRTALVSYITAVLLNIIPICFFTAVLVT